MGELLGMPQWERTRPAIPWSCSSLRPTPRNSGAGEDFGRAPLRPKRSASVARASVACEVDCTPWLGHKLFTR
jgi:hypothetical protein